jgi:hypothetical protein
LLVYGLAQTRDGERREKKEEKGKKRTQPEVMKEKKAE